MAGPGATWALDVAGVTGSSTSTVTSTTQNAAAATLPSKTGSVAAPRVDTRAVRTERHASGAAAPTVSSGQASDCAGASAVLGPLGPVLALLPADISALVNTAACNVGGLL